MRFLFVDDEKEPLLIVNCTDEVAAREIYSEHCDVPMFMVKDLEVIDLSETEEL